MAARTFTLAALALASSAALAAPPKVVVPKADFQKIIDELEGVQAKDCKKAVEDVTGENACDLDGDGAKDYLGMVETRECTLIVFVSEVPETRELAHLGFAELRRDAVLEGCVKYDDRGMLWTRERFADDEEERECWRDVWKLHHYVEQKVREGLKYEERQCGGPEQESTGVRSKRSLKDVDGDGYPEVILSFTEYKEEKTVKTWQEAWGKQPRDLAFKKLPAASAVSKKANKRKK